MDTFVDGCRITLTKKQEAQIKREKKEREKIYNDFEKMLFHFGFTKHPDPEVKGYEHIENDWWAEITDRGCYSDCWAVGEGLKHATAFPGGWNYESPEELEKAISDALDMKSGRF